MRPDAEPSLRTVLRLPNAGTVPVPAGGAGANAKTVSVPTGGAGKSAGAVRQSATACASSGVTISPGTFLRASQL